ncbi:hypothetical protein K474DRAFT_1315071 [Panus rudis PR-1116 ss-1]|nr:hypothetical protein K474DRAFT_1315071 [Panus rudis PR-1116 ss-1]
MTTSITSPQFDSVDADIVLRSCPSPDYSVEFRVHKCILSAASPFFRDMFSLPQAPSHPDGGSQVELPPIIDVSESAEVLSTLLQFVYPTTRPSIDTLEELVLILDAATKYDVTVAIEALRKILVAPSYLEQCPTRVYALASHFDLDEEAKLASRYTLRTQIIDIPLHKDLQLVSPYDYQRLLTLHQTRAAAAEKLLIIPDEVKCMMCNGTHYGYLLPPKWWDDFQTRATRELRLRPTTDVIFSLPFLAQSAKAGCERCAGSILEAHWFLEDLKAKIDALPCMI